MMNRILIILLCLLMLAGCVKAPANTATDEPDVTLATEGTSHITEAAATTKAETTSAEEVSSSPTEEATTEVTTTTTEATTTATEVTTTEATTATTEVTTTEAETTTTEITTEATTTEKVTTAEVTTEKEETLEPLNFYPTDSFVKLQGRNYLDGDKTLWLLFTDSAAEFSFVGNSLSVVMAGDSTATGKADTNTARFAVYVDGEKLLDELMTEKEKTYTVFEDSEPGYHTVKIIKLSEAAQSAVGIKYIKVNSLGYPAPLPEKDLKIEFIGDSITCAYGVDDEVKEHHFSTATQDGTKSYAYKTAMALDADYSLVSYSGYGIISAYTGDGTLNEWGLMPKYYEVLANNWSAPIGAQSKEWDFVWQPDIIVLNLGQNDSSYVKGDSKKAELFQREYTEFLKQLRENNPHAHIVCTLGLMGTDLFDYVQKAIKDYTEQTGDKNISSLKLSVHQWNDPIAADWHPAEATHEKAAKELTEHIKGTIG